MLLAIGLATVYVVFFTHWFQPQVVRIFHVTRNLRAEPRRGNALPNFIFGMSREIRLTELKVVPLAGFETNHDILPVWHLISDSNSVPVKTFFYGEFIRGMRPYFKGVGPEALETNIPYRMFVTAGKITGQHDFEVK